MEHAKHIIRAVLLLVLAMLVFVLVRHALIPRTFGDYGHYRYSSVQEFAAQSPRHGDRGACAECHEEQPEALAEGAHASISCEVCHAPLSEHVTDETPTGPMPVNDSYKACARCHEWLVARPKEFPQIKIPEHVIEGGERLSARVCLECHDAHNPS